MLALILLQLTGTVVTLLSHLPGAPVLRAFPLRSHQTKRLQILKALFRCPFKVP